MRHACVRGEVSIGVWLGGPKLKDHWEGVGVGERIKLRCTFMLGNELSGSV
jgi:hypothetical protein